MTEFTLGMNTCVAVKRWPEPEEWARIFAEDFYRDLAAGGFLLRLKYRALSASVDLVQNRITGNGPFQFRCAVGMRGSTAGAREHFDLKTR